MKPVTQLIDSPTNGDCFRACVASILELDPHDLPNPGHDGDPNKAYWLDQWNGLFAPYNLRLIVPSNGTHFEIPFYIWSITSPRYEGKTHAVVAGHDRKREGSEWYMAWDPSPWRDTDPERRAEFYAKPHNAYIFVSIDPRVAVREYRWAGGHIEGPPALPLDDESFQHQMWSLSYTSRDPRPEDAPGRDPVPNQPGDVPLSKARPERIDYPE